MKKKGFTLIELLAVIIILAVIALIATPIVLNVVKQSRIGAAKASANGVVDAARLYYYDSIMDGKKFDGSSNEFDNFKDRLQGGSPENDAIVYISEDGEVAISVVYNGLCFIKHFNTGVENGIETEVCEIGATSMVLSDYAIVNFYDWDNTLIGSMMAPKGDGRKR